MSRRWLREASVSRAMLRTGRGWLRALAPRLSGMSSSIYATVVALGFNNLLLPETAPRASGVRVSGQAAASSY